jgi:hypothetical protein
MRKLLLAAVAATALLPLTPAFAVGPGSSVLIYPTKLSTYTGAILNLTPAASATDVVTLTGSASKMVTVDEVKCTGTSTAAASLPIELILRSTADTGGTSTSPTIASHDSNNAAATGVFKAYTANPTVGTSAGVVDIALLMTLAPASTGVNGFDNVYEYLPTDHRQPIVLRGTANQMAVNFSGTSIASGGSLSCAMTWTEN